MPIALLAFTLAAFFAAGWAYGQQQSLRIEVPYEFVLGSKVLPAGTYSFSADDKWLVVKSAAGGGFYQQVISRLGGPSELFRDGSVIFDKTNGKRVLAEVWIPGMNGVLVHSNPKNQDRDVLLGSTLDQTHPASGKAAYNLTCSRCHGPDGNGNEKADKFFKVVIPRLNSAAVQSKSDAELKQLITQGIRNMPPVEIDEAGFRHRLPSQDVDAVIAYVRTLKR
jgi:mono/diheme cytochrome c family protein